VEVEYTEAHWKLLDKKREIALSVLRKLRSLGMVGYVYGSVARGDVREESDVDVVVFNPNVLNLDLIEADHRFVIQATPFSTPKAYISLDPEEKEVITFPLGKLKRDEEEFFRFGGLIDEEGILRKERVSGVNKRLQLIIPTEKGHEEMPLKGNEGLASKLLKVSISTIMEREKLLTKRMEKGRTGVFLRYDLGEDESFESSIVLLSKNNKFFRKMVND